MFRDVTFTMLKKYRWWLAIVGKSDLNILFFHTYFHPMIIVNL